LKTFIQLNSLNYTSAYEKAVGYGPGIAWELLRDMAHQLNLTFDVQTLEGEGWGQRLDNGSWTGAFGRLYDGVGMDPILVKTNHLAFAVFFKHAEILAGGSMMTPERYANFDFSTAIGYQSSAILIRQPRRRNFVANMLVNSFGWKVRPSSQQKSIFPSPPSLCSKQIWLSLLACFFLAMLAFHFIQQKISKVAPEKNYGLADTLILFFAVFSKQRNYLIISQQSADLPYLPQLCRSELPASHLVGPHFGGHPLDLLHFLDRHFRGQRHFPVRPRHFPASIYKSLSTFS
jgi:hypothetical protein